MMPPALVAMAVSMTPLALAALRRRKSGVAPPWHPAQVAGTAVVFHSVLPAAMLCALATPQTVELNIHAKLSASNMRPNNGSAYFARRFPEYDAPVK